MGGSMDIAFVPIGMSGYVGEAVYCWGVDHGFGASR